MDWSAAGTPRSGTDSIWIADFSPHSGTLSLENPRTRLAARASLLNLARAAVTAQQRLLIAVDFPLGYPKGMADSFGLNSEPSAWQSVWRHLNAEISDDLRNNNNRFDVAIALNRRGGAAHGPFWGCPISAESRHLSTRRPTLWPIGGLQEYRYCERAAQTRLKARPQSVWKLAYTGSVGSQALTGIPVAAAIRNDAQLRDHCRVWPFETAALDLDAASRPLIIIAEMYPSLFDDGGDAQTIRDVRQVTASCRAFAGWDEDGVLARHLSLEAHESAAKAAAIAEEGWILGV